jgi:hypothetical protein
MGTVVITLVAKKPFVPDDQTNNSLMIKKDNFPKILSRQIWLNKNCIA